MPRSHHRADVARDLAAPVEDAVAALPRDVLFGDVAPPAAQQVTPVHPDGRRVAFAPFSVAAEVGRVLVVHEVVPVGRLVVRVDGQQVELGRSLAGLPAPLSHAVAPFVP